MTTPRRSSRPEDEPQDGPRADAKVEGGSAIIEPTRPVSAEDQDEEATAPPPETGPGDVSGPANPVRPDAAEAVAETAGETADEGNVHGRPVLGRNADGLELVFKSEEEATAAGHAPSGFADGGPFVASRPAYLDREERGRAAAAAEAPEEESAEESTEESTPAEESAPAEESDAAADEDKD